MSDDALLLCMFSFWAGYAYRCHGQRKIDRDGLRAFGAGFIETCRRIKRDRRLIGEGPSIQNVSRFEVAHVGSFVMTIEEE